MHEERVDQVNEGIDMPTLDPRLDCILRMTEAERQEARQLARRRQGLRPEAEEAAAAPVTTRIFIRLTDAAGAREG